MELQLYYTKKELERKVLTLERELNLAKLLEDSNEDDSDEAETIDEGESVCGQEKSKLWLSSNSNVFNHDQPPKEDKKIVNEVQPPKGANQFVIDTYPFVSPFIEKSKVGQSDLFNDMSKNVSAKVSTPNVEVAKIKTTEDIANPTSSSEGIRNDLRDFIARQSIPQQLPQFSGDPIEWPCFYSEYINSSKICNFSQYENLNRLKRALTGNAKETVQSLLILPENVDKIIDILKNRFGKPQHIIRYLIDKVRNFPTIREDKIETFLKFYDIFTNLIYTLQSLDEKDHINNPMLFDEILGKFPLSRRLSFLEHCEHLSTNKPRIVLLHEWLSRKVDAATQLISTHRDDEKFKSKGLDRKT